MRVWGPAGRDGELEFSTFLTMMHTQIKQEDPQKEILLAMLMADKEKKGYLPAAELRSKLTNLGEKLTHKEGGVWGPAGRAVLVGAWGPGLCRGSGHRVGLGVHAALGPWGVGVGEVRS